MRTVVLREESGIPVLLAHQDERGHLWFYCDYCRTVHKHGKGPGHRVAHCIEESSPFRVGGYILATE